MNRDQRIVEDAQAEDKLMCQAHNCPNRWSVDAGQGKLCSAHAWADPMDWGAVTSQIHSRQLMGIQKRYEEPVKRMTAEEKLAVLENLKTVLKGPKDPKAWAHKLRQREGAGESLSRIQKSMWRDALGIKDDQA